MPTGALKGKIPRFLLAGLILPCFVVTLLLIDMPHCLVGPGTRPVLAAPPQAMSSSPPKAADLDKIYTIKEKNLSRACLVHVPPSYTGKEPVPLVFVLHGGGGNCYVARRITEMNDKADKEGFIVAYPNGTGLLKKHLLTWNAVDCCGYAKSKTINDVLFIDSLIDKFSSEFNIDKSRIYVAGYSNGGMLAYLVASKLSNRIAAIGCVGGSMSGKEDCPDSPVSVIIFHGTADKHVPYTGGVGKLAKWGYPVNSMSVAYAVSFWAKADGCSSDPKQKQIEQVIIDTYDNGKYGSEVILYTIQGGLHSWPGGQRTWIKADLPFPNLSATDEIWDFFAKHPKTDNLEIKKAQDNKLNEKGEERKLEDGKLKKLKSQMIPAKIFLSDL